MVEEKGLEPAVADKIGDYVKLSGGTDLLMKLKADKDLTSNVDAQKGLKDMELLLHYCGIFKLEKVIQHPFAINCWCPLPCFIIQYKISFDLSLARGLDYYTGVIFEAILTGI